MKTYVKNLVKLGCFLLLFFVFAFLYSSHVEKVNASAADGYGQWSEKYVPATGKYFKYVGKAWDTQGLPMKVRFTNASTGATELMYDEVLNNGGNGSSAEKTYSKDFGSGKWVTDYDYFQVYNVVPGTNKGGQKLANGSASSPYYNYKWYTTFTTNCEIYSPKPNYTISYSLNGGSGTTPSSQTVKSGTSVTLASCSATRQGYRFNGWSIGGSVKSAGSSYTVTSNVTASASWVANSYTLYYNANGSNASVSPSSKSVTYDLPYDTLATPTRTGWRFDGWYTASSDGSLVTSSSKYTTVGNQTIYAHWTVQNYSVTCIDKCGSEQIGSSSASKPYGSMVWGSDIISGGRTGYTYQYDTNATVTTSGATVYRYFTANYYEVTCIDKWGSTELGRGSADRAYNTTVRGSDIRSQNYTGYTYSYDSSITVRTSGNTVYRYFDRTSYRITYNGNNNTSGSVPSQQTLYYDESISISSNTGNLARKGYDFNGWNVSSSGTGKSYSPGDTYSTNAALTLYAKWSVRDDTPYKVRHWQMKVGGSGYDLIETENFIGTTEDYASPDVKTYTGFTSPTKTSKQITGDGNMIVDYYYTRNKYKVYYDIGPGYQGYPEYEEVWYGQDFVKDFNLKPGYTFKSMEKHKK